MLTREDLVEMIERLEKSNRKGKETALKVYKEMLEHYDEDYSLISKEVKEKIKKWREEHPEEAALSDEINDEISIGIKKYNEMLHNGVSRDVAWEYLMGVKNSVQSKSKFPEIYEYSFLYPDMLF